jgi:hypothetical protein
LTREFFTENNMIVISNPLLLSLLPRFKIILGGCHFDTVEVIEAESQAVMNTLTEPDFQDAFKKWQKRWERCIRVAGDHFEGVGGQYAQIYGSTCLENYRWMRNLKSCTRQQFIYVLFQQSVSKNLIFNSYSTTRYSVYIPMTG